MKDIVILYHASCADGFGAAYAAWKKFRERAEYIPVQYGQDPPIKEDNLPQRLYILDFSYPRHVLTTLRDYIPHVTVLDHHKTAREDLEDLGKPVNVLHVDEPLSRHSRGIFIAFNEQESGATMAWQYFFPREEIPDLLQYVRDRDLWKWEMQKSKEVSAGLGSYPYDFQLWDKLCEELNILNPRLVREGEAILRRQAKDVDAICKSPWLSEIGGWAVPTVNTCLYQSEVGEALCLKYPDAPFSASYMDISPTERVYSLRSHGEFDVSAVAKQFGGGGHKNAAGFKRKVS